MMALIARFVPALASRGALIGLGVAFAAGIAAGGWAVAKFHKAAEVAELEARLEAVRDGAQAATAALDAYYSDQLTIARDRVTIREVIRHVPTDPVCNVSDAERRMLNRARGVPETPGGPAGEGGPAAPGGELPRAVEVAAHADCGERFRRLKSRHDRLVDFLDRMEAIRDGAD